MDVTHPSRASRCSLVRLTSRDVGTAFFGEQGCVRRREQWSSCDCRRFGVAGFAAKRDEHVLCLSWLRLTPSPASTNTVPGPLVEPRFRCCVRESTRKTPAYKVVHAPHTKVRRLWVLFPPASAWLSAQGCSRIQVGASFIVLGLPLS